MRIRTLLSVIAVALAWSVLTGHPTAVAQQYPPMVVDEEIPNVKNEDSLSRLERLDDLSLQTHRQLSIARTQQQPKETIEKLEKKIEKINEQRVATMKKLRVAH
jgi:hypothetical protein